MAKATEDLLEVFPIYLGDGMLLAVKNRTKGTSYTVDTLRRRCDCRFAEVHPGKVCKHLARGDEWEAEQREIQSRMPLNAARGKARATGVREMPQFKTLSAEENEALKAVFA